MAASLEPSLLLHREAGPNGAGMSTYSVEFQQDGPTTSAVFTVLIAEQSAETANLFRAVDEALAVARSFIAHQLTPIAVQ